MRTLMFWMAVCVLVLACAVAQSAQFKVVDSEAGDQGVRVIGPPSRFMEDVTRYDRTRADKTPVPQVKVTRQTYLEFIPKDSAYGAEAICNNTDRGIYGVRHAFPALAQYAATGNKRYEEAIKKCLKFYEKAVRERVAKNKWHQQYMFAPTLLCMYRRIFKEHNAWTQADEKWFKQFYLWLCRTVHVWGGPKHFWRGPMHRATGEGIMKLLAVTMYPDIPEAKQWRRYAELQWNDWWKFRDNPINDINYFHGQIFPVVLGAHLLGREEVFTDPQMRKFWDRLIDMTTPDGAIVPFGPALGWNSHAGERMMALEMAATYTGDGRYRFAAHRILNYLRYQQDVLRPTNLGNHFSQIGAAVCYFVANDDIKPVQPYAGSTVLYHKETLRVNGKKGAARYLVDLDPDPMKAHVDCALLCTDKVLPFKLCLRSGWKPGDMYMLVDLFPRHEPMNPTGVLGLVRYNSVLACAIDSKGLTDWLNMFRVDDLSGTASVVTNQNPDTVDAYYMDVTVPEFTDRPLGTYAAVDVKDYNGYPMTLRREFFFIKNRFVILRDTARFSESFLARIGPVWYTQNVGPQVGENWANTYFMAPIFEGQKLHNPPMDLLVYHAPRQNRRLLIVDDTADVRRLKMPFTLRYVQDGIVGPDQKVCFTQLLMPGLPSRQPVRSNVPGAASLESIYGQYMAAGVKVLIDNAEQSVWRIRTEQQRQEWVVLNEAGKSVAADGLETDARQVYVDLTEGKVARALVLGGTYLKLAGKEIFRRAERGDYEK